MAAERQYVVFRLGEQAYGADIGVVREVNYLLPVTWLPNTPPYVDGVIDLRGEVMPVIDLRKRLGMALRPADGDTRVMILDLGVRSAAVVVDGVEQVVTLRPDEIVPPDADLVIPGEEYVLGVARANAKLVVLFDLGRLMDPARMAGTGA